MRLLNTSPIQFHKFEEAEKEGKEVEKPEEDQKYGEQDGENWRNNFPRGQERTDSEDGGG